MKEETIVYLILEFIKDRRRRDLNVCNVNKSALVGMDIANIQRTLEKLGYETYVNNDGLEIRW